MALIVNTAEDSENYLSDQPDIKYVNLRIPYNSTGWESRAQICFNDVTDQIIQTITGRSSGTGSPGGDSTDSSRGKNVLIHCVHGTHESPVVAIAFLMRFARKSLRDAFRHLQQVMRSGTEAMPVTADGAREMKISPGFVDQLGEYEKVIFNLESPTLTIADVRRGESKLWASEFPSANSDSD